VGTDIVHAKFFEGPRDGQTLMVPSSAGDVNFPIDGNPGNCYVYHRDSSVEDAVHFFYQGQGDPQDFSPTDG
jgi:hypothetical protein